MSASPGLLALVGGDEFKPGNEPQDEALARAALAGGHGGSGPSAFIVASAAARHDPDAAVATARAWFGGFELPVEELPLRSRRQANDPAIAELASGGSFFYLAGGDPGNVVRILEATRTWAAILSAWEEGAVLAGSSAGAMALGSWTLVRARHPGDARRDARPALGVVPGIAVAPHFETFGHRWVPEARPAVVTAGGRLLGIDERTAAVWSAGEWRVHGAGGVTVIGTGEQRYRSGEVIAGLPEPTASGPGR